MGERKTGGRRAEVAGGRGRADDERRSSVGARSGGRRARAGGALTRGDGEREMGREPAAAVCVCIAGDRAEEKGIS